MIISISNSEKKVTFTKKNMKVDVKSSILLNTKIRKSFHINDREVTTNFINKYLKGDSMMKIVLADQLSDFTKCELLKRKHLN